MTTGGTIRFVLTGDTSGLDKSSDKAKKNLSDIRDEFKKNIAASAKFAAGIVAAGTALAIGLTVKGLAAADAQAKLARSLNGTVNGLNALKMAAGDAGLDGLEGALNRLNRRLGAAEMGGGAAAVTVEKLGLNLEYINGLDVDEKVAHIADVMKELNLTTQEQARHLQNLGFEQKAATELFAAGGDAIRKYRGEVDALGLSMTEMDTTKIEMANDAMGIFGDVAQAVQQRLAIGMAPTLATIAGLIEDAWIETEQFGLSAQDFERKFANALASALEGTASFLRFFENRSEIAELGLIGYVMFGKKGAAIGGAIGAAFALVNAELRKMGVGVDDNAARMARMTERAESLNNALAGAREAQGRGQNMDRQITNYESQLALVNADLENLRATMSDSAWEDFNQFFVEGGSAAGGMADNMDRVAQAIRDGVDAQNEAAGGIIGGRGGEGEGEGGGSLGLTDMEKEAIANRLMVLQESLMAERELMQHKYEQDRELLISALDNELMDREAYAQAREELARRHQNDLSQVEAEAAEERKKIAEAEANAKMALAKSVFGDISTLMNTESRKLFEVGKAAAIANAIVDTHAGMTKALAQGGWAGIAMAAAVGAKGFASVSAIRSQSFGGGGAGAQATGSNTAAINAATTPVGGNSGGGGPQQNTVINLSGDFFGETQIRGLLERINETTRNGGRIILG